MALFEEALTGKIIGAAVEVHKQLGPGLLESIYEECLEFELLQAGLSVERQKPLPVEYKSLKLQGEYFIDLLVDGRVIIELKTVEHILPVHEAQLMTYMKLANIKVGLLLNFNVAVLKQGVRRIVI